MPGGSWRNVLEIADCTSCAAASMLRDSVNCSVMLVPPSVLDDVMASSPAIVENCFSRGVATAAAIVCGLAPGRPAETVIVGKSTFGRSLTGSNRYAIIPNMRMPKITRPERAVTVRKATLEQDAPCCRVHLIVDEGQHPLHGSGRVARRQCEHRQRLPSPLTQGRQIDGGDGEPDQNRPQLDDRYEGIGAGAHEVAFVEQDASRAAADGRADGRILEVETRERRGGGIGAYHAGSSVGCRLFLLVVLLRDGIGRRQLAIARGFACRARRLR